MRRALIGVTTSAVLVLMASTISIGQQPQPAPEPPDIVHGKIFQGPEGFPPPLPPNFLFVSSEVGFAGKVVKGAPYSAEAVTETIQTLGDGNRIVNKTTSVLYRDNEGRTRREQALRAIGGFASGVEPVQTIFISDPVAGVSYSLDSRNNVAYKTVPLKLEQKLFRAGTPAVGTEPLMQKFELKIESKKGPSGVGTVFTAPVPGPEGEQFMIRTDSGSVGYVMNRRKTGEDPHAVKESLGRQMVEGVEADGTRVTITIPAGEIGNDRPIQVVSEHWYSPELQVIVMSRHSDPRVGETTYRLTNINRTEPAKSLFEVPAGYTVSEGLPGLFKQAPVTVKKKMANPE